jgi:hypothetical protein
VRSGSESGGMTNSYEKGKEILASVNDGIFLDNDVAKSR